MKSNVSNKVLEWINLVLGACLACGSAVIVGSGLAAWNAGITGALIACFSAIALYSNANRAARYNLVLGCWAVVAPFVLGFGTVAVAMWLHVAIGLCVAAIATAQSLADRRARPASPR
ncbi:MAG: hypothetical protein EOO23_09315 [Comamonadaceae bacterium]|nr:MAG: hypothetical protein EOO23_09315 [Comamonadaceae bacterium]